MQQDNIQSPVPGQGEAGSTERSEAGSSPALDDLSAELAETRQALADMKDTVLRERADLENQRRRVARDLEQARKFANERLLSDLLPVFDSLEAGLASETGDPVKLREGMELTLKQLGKVVTEYGMDSVDPRGAAFDPERHQAMSAVVSPEHPENTVVQVYQKGYSLNGRLLRPALVVVSKSSD